MWSTVSKRVIGIDIRKAFWRDGFFALYLDYRRRYGRFASLARAFVDRRVYHNYFDELRNLAGVQIDEYNQELRSYNGVNLPFSDESFDIVCSYAVLEHVHRNDMGRLVDEIARWMAAIGSGRGERSLLSSEAIPTALSTCCEKGGVVIFIIQCM